MLTLVDREDKGSSNAFTCFLHALNNYTPFSTLWFVFSSPSLDFDTENQTVGSPGNEDLNVCTCLCGNDTRKPKISVYTKLP